jgi:hypothetical protein
MIELPFTLSRPVARSDVANTMVSSGLQLGTPSAFPANRHTRLGGPPETAIFFSSWPSKKPSHRPSKEKNGARASKTPRTGSALRRANGRIMSGPRRRPEV